MELKVIRHKTAKDFFEGFYPEEQVGSYAYQLERMFEQGTAVEGDYFLVTEKDKPILSLEIYRNNTRRILEKMPTVAIGIEASNEDFTKALTLIFDYLSEDMIYGSIDKELQVSISEDYHYFNEYESLLKKYKFLNVTNVARFEVSSNDLEVPKKSECTYKQLINISAEERFELVSKSTFNELLDRYSNEKVYIDLLEEGYQSEELWETIEFNDKEIGYMMPVFTNGLRNRLELLNYGYFNRTSNKLFFNAVIERVVQVLKENEIEEIILNINLSDTEFIDQIMKYGSTKYKLIKNYIRI